MKCYSSITSEFFLIDMSELPYRYFFKLYLHSLGLITSYEYYWNNDKGLPSFFADDELRMCEWLGMCTITYQSLRCVPIRNGIDSHTDLNILRKERVYTKLKYSRTPAYDIVSGGAASFFSGLLGFLASEKFGLELVDSGDFYYIVMYAVFLTFACRPLFITSGPVTLKQPDRNFAELLK